MNTMLKTRNGGTKAPGGLYWHFGNWEIKALDGKEVTLPGGAEERYVRIPTVALLVLGPIMGLAFAMFLPFAAIAVIFYFLLIRPQKREQAARESMLSALKRRTSCRRSRRC